MILGNALQTSADSHYAARHVALKAGIPFSVPAVTVNMISGSGLLALIQGARTIQLGEADICLVGGIENMSQTPHVIRGARGMSYYGNSMIEDLLDMVVRDSYNGMTLATAVEKMARKFNIGRIEQDEYALRSYQAAVNARNMGILKEETISVVLKDSRGNEVATWLDDYVREISIRELIKMKPAIRHDGGITLGNSSSLADGAAVLIIMSAEKAGQLGLRPRARLASFGIAGVDPDQVAMGAVAALGNAVKESGIEIGDLDLLEIHEGFAAQYLVCEKEMNLNREKVNVNGGAIAFGHPMAASGARMALTLVYEMNRRDAQYGAVSIPVEGGQGIAVVLRG